MEAVMHAKHCSRIWDTVKLGRLRDQKQSLSDHWEHTLLDTLGGRVNHKYIGRGHIQAGWSWA